MKKDVYVIFQSYFEYELYYCQNHVWKRNIEDAITYKTKQLANKHLYRLQTYATQQLKNSNIDINSLAIKRISNI